MTKNSPNTGAPRIPAQKLREIAEQAIEDHVDLHQLGVLQKVEAEERRELTRIAEVVG